MDLKATVALLSHDFTRVEIHFNHFKGAFA